MKLFPLIISYLRPPSISGWLNIWNNLEGCHEWKKRLSNTCISMRPVAMRILPSSTGLSKYAHFWIKKETQFVMAIK